jgi:hypothetical protein
VDGEEMFTTDQQATELSQPRVGAFDDPASSIATQDLFSGYGEPRSNSASPRPHHENCQDTFYLFRPELCFDRSWDREGYNNGNARNQLFFGMDVIYKF